MTTWHRFGLAGFLMVFGALALPQTTQAQQIGSTNPYIDDGSIKESPFTFKKYPISEVRSDFNEHNHPMLNHYTTANYETIAKDFQNAYKAQREISPNILVIGFAFLTPKGHWSFTLRDSTQPNYMLLIEVMPNKASGAGSIISLHARPHANTPRFVKRAWVGYSPSGLDKMSIAIYP